MSKIWKSGNFAQDVFVAIDDTAPLPTGKAVIVSLNRWRSARAELLALEVPLGVLVEPTAGLDAGADAISKIDTIVIPFLKFIDGRGYSLARRLRDELGYRGEIRATGDVLIDQIPLMLRCGFDAFTITHAATLRALESGHLPAIAEVYQTAAYGRARTSAAFTSRPAVLVAAG